MAGEIKSPAPAALEGGANQSPKAANVEVQKKSPSLLAKAQRLFKIGRAQQASAPTGEAALRDFGSAKVDIQAAKPEDTFVHPEAAAYEDFARKQTGAPSPDAGAIEPAPGEVATQDVIAGLRAKLDAQPPYEPVPLPTFIQDIQREQAAVPSDAAEARGRVESAPVVVEPSVPVNPGEAADNLRRMVQQAEAGATDVKAKAAAAGIPVAGEPRPGFPPAWTESADRSPIARQAKVAAPARANQAAPQRVEPPPVYETPVLASEPAPAKAQTGAPSPDAGAIEPAPVVVEPSAAVASETTGHSQETMMQRARRLAGSTGEVQTDNASATPSSSDAFKEEMLQERADMIKKFGIRTDTANDSVVVTPDAEAHVAPAENAAKQEESGTLKTAAELAQERGYVSLAHASRVSSQAETVVNPADVQDLPTAYDMGNNGVANRQAAEAPRIVQPEEAVVEPLVPVVVGASPAAENDTVQGQGVATGEQNVRQATRTEDLSPAGVEELTRRVAEAGGMTTEGVQRVAAEVVSQTASREQAESLTPREQAMQTRINSLEAKLETQNKAMEKMAEVLKGVLEQGLNGPITPEQRKGINALMLLLMSLGLVGASVLEGATK